MLRVSCKAILITAACTVTVAKFHSRGLAEASVASQDLARFLSVLRAAAASNSLPDAAPSRSRRADTQDL
ncbi:hypothetical protein BH18ACI5_BH18ACI5_25260 [soil metagenome]